MKEVPLKLEKNKEEFKSVFKLKRYYYILYISAPITVLLIGLSIYIFPQYFPWVLFPKTTLFLCILAIFFHIYGFVNNLLNPNKKFWLLQCLVWVGFDIAFAAVTGGINSPILFLVTITLIATASRLKYKEIAIVGIVTIALIVLLAAFQTSYLFDPISLTKNILTVLFYTIFVYFVYVLVKETLSQKYQKEEAQRKFIQLSEFNQVKETFLSVTSHQLRTPLTGVKWALESVVRDEKISEENRQLVKVSVERVDNSIKIIGDMLKAVEANAEELNYKVNNTEISVKNLIKKTVDEFIYFIQDKKVTLKLDDKLTDQVKIIGNPDTFGFAFSNVIDNAIRYSPNGKVNILLEKEDDFIKVVVEDNGVGIDKVDQQFIFGKFYRGKNAIAIDSNETGVGLYSTKKVIESYGGTIVLTSEIGKGTKVIIKLPINK